MAEFSARESHKQKEVHHAMFAVPSVWSTKVQRCLETVCRPIRSRVNERTKMEFKHTAPERNEHIDHIDRGAYVVYSLGSEALTFDNIKAVFQMVSLHAHEGTRLHSKPTYQYSFAVVLHLYCYLSIQSFRQHAALLSIDHESSRVASTSNNQSFISGGAPKRTRNKVWKRWQHQPNMF